MNHLGKFHHELTVRAKPGNHGLGFGKSSPFMAARFRLVNYDNLPRCFFLGNMNKAQMRTMVLVDLPTKLDDFVRANVGKYGAYMEHMGT